MFSHFGRGREEMCGMFTRQGWFCSGLCCVIQLSTSPRCQPFCELKVLGVGFRGFSSYTCEQWSTLQSPQEAVVALWCCPWYVP